MYLRYITLEWAVTEIPRTHAKHSLICTPSKSTRELWQRQSVSIFSLPTTHSTYQSMARLGMLSSVPPCECIQSENALRVRLTDLQLGWKRKGKAGEEKLWTDQQAHKLAALYEALFHIITKSFTHNTQRIHETCSAAGLQAAASRLFCLTSKLQTQKGKGAVLRDWHSYIHQMSKMSYTDIKRHSENELLEILMRIRESFGLGGSPQAHLTHPTAVSKDTSNKLYFYRLTVFKRQLFSIKSSSKT